MLYLTVLFLIILQQGLADYGQVPNLAPHLFLYGPKTENGFILLSD